MAHGLALGIRGVVPWNCNAAECIAPNRMIQNRDPRHNIFHSFHVHLDLRVLIQARGLGDHFNGRLFLVASNQALCFGEEKFSPVLMGAIFFFLAHGSDFTLMFTVYTLI